MTPQTRVVPASTVNAISGDEVWASGLDRSGLQELASRGPSVSVSSSAGWDNDNSLFGNFPDDTNLRFIHAGPPVNSSTTGNVLVDENNKPISFMEASKRAMASREAGGTANFARQSSPFRSVVGDSYRLAVGQALNTNLGVGERAVFGTLALGVAIPGLFNDIVRDFLNAPSDLYYGGKEMASGWSLDDPYLFSDGLMRSSVGLLGLAGGASILKQGITANLTSTQAIEYNAARATYGAGKGADETLNLYSGSELDAGFVAPLRGPGAETLHVFGSQPVRGTTFSGHGGWSPVNGTVLVPEGTSLTVYAEHGASISNRLGNVIETGGDVSKVYSRTFMPGEVAPNYVLHPPGELSLLGGTTVRTATPLESLLQPNMGPVNWAACVSNYRSPSANLVYGVDGIFDSFGVQNPNFWKQVKKY